MMRALGIAVVVTAMAATALQGCSDPPDIVEIRRQDAQRAAEARIRLAQEAAKTPQQRRDECLQQQEGRLAREFDVSAGAAAAEIFWTCEPHDTPDIRAMSPRSYNDFKEASLLRIAAEIDDARRR